MRSSFEKVTHSEVVVVAARWAADVCSWMESEALCRSFDGSPVLLAFDNIVAELAQKAGAA